MTITPTMLDAGVKTNSIPDRAQPDLRRAGAAGPGRRVPARGARAHLRGHGVEIDINYTAVSNASPADSPFVELCRQSLALALGNEDFSSCRR